VNPSQQDDPSPTANRLTPRPLFHVAAVRRCSPIAAHPSTPPTLARRLRSPPPLHTNAPHTCPSLPTCPRMCTPVRPRSCPTHTNTPRRRPSLPHPCTPPTNCTPPLLALPSLEREGEDNKTENEHVQAARQKTSMLGQQDRRIAREDSKTEE